MSPRSGGDGLHFVSLSAVTWGFPLVGRTRMLTEAWQQLGHRTTFVQVPSYRTGFERLAGRAAQSGEAAVVRPWPGPPSRSWRWLGEQRLQRLLGGRARALARQLERHADPERSVAIVVSPVWAPWLRELRFRAVVYDCIDDLAVHIPRKELAPLYRRWEDELVDGASMAVVSATGLGEDLRARRPDLPVATVQNGVDTEWFRLQARLLARPADLPPPGRPLVGFVGALYDWIDWELIGGVARRLPDIDFVLVGPHGRGRGSGLDGGGAGAPNLHFIGARPYAQVPAYVQAFDACWVPFKRDRVGRMANPVKIYEYLALGKPVVSSPVADVESFEGLVATGETAEDHAALLKNALREPVDERKRVELAGRSSWKVRASQYAALLESIA